MHAKGACTFTSFVGLMKFWTEENCQIQQYIKPVLILYCVIVFYTLLYIAVEAIIIFQISGKGGGGGGGH